MDPLNPNPSAATTPSAAVSPAPIGEATPPVAGTPPPQAVPQPAVSGQAPPQAGTPLEPSPEGTGQPPGASPTPPVDWEARARALEQQQRQRDQQLQQVIAAAQREQAEQQERQASEQRRQETYQLARTMDPDRAFDYIQNFENQERARLANRIQEVQQMSRQQLEATVQQVAAPLYADHLAKQHNLPPDLHQQLRSVPGPMMDVILPTLVSAAQVREQAKAQFQQQQLTQQAHQMQQTGAYTVGGVHAPSGGSAPPRPTPRRQRDQDDYAALIAAKRGR